MATIFNRKDPSVIQFALSNPVEAFVNEYSVTSASEEALRKAYTEITTSKTKAAIATKSGKGAPTEPLEPIAESTVYALDKDGDIKKVDTTDVPTRTDLDDATFTKEGSVESKPESTEKKPAAKKEVKAKKETTPKATPTPKKEGELSKRDVIRQLFKDDATLTNRQVKDAIKERGYASCYDSEINSCRTVA